MTYSVLTVGLPDKLIKALQALIFQYDLSFTSSATTREASRLLEQQVFHLLIIGLDYLKNIHQADWLTDIRSVSFVPLIVLSSRICTLLSMLSACLGGSHAADEPGAGTTLDKTAIYQNRG